MQVYHREATQSTVDRNLPIPIQELTMRDLQQAVKG